MTLKTYRQKRNFKKTTEPIGKVKKKRKKSNLIFVVQKHAASHLHYDFRLELEGVLKSWAIPKGPCLDPSIKRLAVHVEDHPLEYGTFEGIIPEGEYGGGTVMLWDQGIWIPEEQDALSAYQKGNLSFSLNGKKLKGSWKLIQLKNDPKNWLLMKLNDKYVKPLNQYDITIAKPNSVISQKSIAKIAAQTKQVWGNTIKKSTDKIAKKKVKKHIIQLTSDKNPFPKIIYPQLATLVDKPPSGNAWLHEIKFDGYRFIAFKELDTVRLMTRNNNDWTNKFPTIVHELKQLPISNVILDGEIVVFDKQQRSNFQLLQNAIKAKSNQSFTYYIFDIIYYKETDLSSLSLIDRKKILYQLISSFDCSILRYSDHIMGSGEEVFKRSCDFGLEGIISKNINSPYTEGRNKNWLKIKCLKQQEFVIGGYTIGKKNRQYFGSLLIGTYNKDKELIYHGHVGTGFTESSLKTIYALLEKYKTKHMPFKERPSGSQKITWVKPKLVAEIAFSDWTRDDILRQPSFKGLRNDKNPLTITKEMPTVIKNIRIRNSSQKKNIGYKLTNPEKILYAEKGITKLQIAEYYEFVHRLILPYVINRPLSLLRCPDGYQECFYQKHLNEAVLDGLHEILIKEKNNEESGIYIKDKQGLLALVQLGVLEIHPWGSHIELIEYPDIITFDLDPSPEVKWKKLVAAAFEIKKYLEELKLKSFVKSTGGKGLHVVIPIEPNYDWESVKLFTQTFVNLVVEQKPTEYTSNMNKAKRKNKIFIDYLRNQRGATAIAPYSTRANQDASVATPLGWDELTNDKRDTYFTLKTLPKRLEELKHDPWRDFFKLKQRLHLNE